VTTTDSATTLGDLVADNPATARVLDGVGLDYCCDGDRTLDEACAAAGLDPAAVADALAAVEGPGDVAWADLGPDALADHIEATHHTYLHDELPLLGALAEKVVGVHGGRPPELVEVRRLVDELRADLEPHLMKEERVLFPAIRALVGGTREFPFGSIANPVRMMTTEHERAGELLDELRRATGGFTVPADACASFRSLYERLAALDEDTRLHVVKENHRLFPAAVALFESA
jgi:regulator of cell morphogenesis and NO signaling